MKIIKCKDHQKARLDGDRKILFFFILRVDGTSWLLKKCDFLCFTDNPFIN